MLKQLKKIIQNINADYVDLRYERKITEFVSIFGNEISNIGKNVHSGYVLRVLKNGGFASVTFCDIEDVNKVIKDVLSIAKINIANMIPSGSLRIKNATYRYFESIPLITAL